MEKFLVVCFFVAFVFLLPAWVAKFKNKRISDQEFLDIVKEGSASKVVEAIKAGADVNAKANNGYTALMAAAGTGHTEIVNAFIKAGADVNAKNKLGGTAMILAVLKGHTEIVNILTKAVTDANAKNNGGGRAKFKNKRISDQEFLDIVKEGSA